ncbi:MAG: TIGR00159 family protein [Bacteroidetes bacterium]|nr:MAG: TIGR00159 family protein [Bacteroidota bacterium]
MENSTVISIGFLDVVDILLVAFILFQLYKMVKGTTAMTIFLGLSSLYIFWLIVRALNMELMSTILGQIMGVGLLAIIIVFQQEIRRFLIYMGKRYARTRSLSLNLRAKGKKHRYTSDQLAEIASACVHMGRSKTGALLVLARSHNLKDYIDTGVTLDASIKARLIESIFFKNSPLHDGATIVQSRRITAAQCILPVSQNPEVPKRLGLRHRAAIGLTEETDALVLVVSEETGMVSIVEEGLISEGYTREELMDILASRTED